MRSTFAVVEKVLSICLPLRKVVKKKYHFAINREVGDGADRLSAA
ncbi:hypothetical protein SAMN05892877_101103 [Rhizobium subbaraonis]|uniref:Uncharacterized protein n=1 Tax=Rhizobium subbaraonis TaxID=908946 RepID=A0A285TZ57_9HYPH|nr:hypothetical protein SAMN05892877_101103 [Rhizobium subbaraonis]